MKSIILFAALLIGVSATAQDQDQKYIYCEISYWVNQITHKQKFEFDFGQDVKEWSINANRIVDESGKVIKFNSSPQVINYMAKMGWEYVNTYSIEEVKGTLTYKHIMKHTYIEGETPDYSPKIKADNK